MNAVAIKVGEIATMLGCTLKGDASLLITEANTIEEATSDQLTFIANPRYRQYLSQCRAGAIISTESEELPATIVHLISEHPYEDFCRALEILYPDRTPKIEVGIHPTAVVSAEATIGKDVRIGSHATVSAGVTIGDGSIVCNGASIGQNVKVGENCIIGNNTVIRDDVIIGDRVVVGDGSVIGFDGFGYAPTKDGYRKIPQVGTVIIEDDVEIGACTCIDRATVGATRIGRGTKIDNLIQIAHGVQIGENTVIAAQTGISGSTKIGSNVLMGGQAGLTGHIEIGDGMIIGAQAGVTKSHDFKGMISGYPARPQGEELRIEATMSKLPEIYKRLRTLEKEVKKAK